VLKSRQNHPQRVDGKRGILSPALVDAGQGAALARRAGALQIRGQRRQVYARFVFGFYRTFAAQFETDRGPTIRKLPKLLLFF
jgi:hypothetical protein